MDASTRCFTLLAMLCSCGVHDALGKPPVISRTIYTTSGKVCMKLSLSAQIYVHEYNGEEARYIDIDNSFNAVSNCLSPTRPVTFSTNGPGGDQYKYLQFTFFKNQGDNSYTMTGIAAGWYDTNLRESFGDQKSSNNFLETAVQLGDSYYCSSELKVKLIKGQATVYMWDFRLQPFAEDSYGEYGPEQSCGISAWVIVGCTLVAVVICVGFCVMTVCVVQHKRRRRRYVHIQGEVCK